MLNITKTQSAQADGKFYKTNRIATNGKGEKEIENYRLKQT